MGDWLSGLWEWGSDTASDIWGGVTESASDIWGGVADLFQDDAGDWDFGSVAGSIPDFSWGDAPNSSPQAGPADIDLGGPVNGEGGGMVQAGWPAAVGAGVVWLGSMLARGATTAGTIFKGANGVSVRLAQLWPLVKKYGPFAVAGGLGISAQQLATLLENSPKTGGGRRGRGRGISSRDVKTTRRTLKTIKKLYHMMPTRRAAYSGGGYRGGYYRRGRR